MKWRNHLEKAEGMVLRGHTAHARAGYAGQIHSEGDTSLLAPFSLF